MFSFVKGKHDMVDQKENLLSSAKEIALMQGISKINIRSVAQKSGVSIGTVYNYYPTKADLIVTVIEDFWAEAFKNIDMKMSREKSFYENIEHIYNSLLEHLHKFKTNWLNQISLLDIEEKKLGRKKEGEYFTRVHAMIISLMEMDNTISAKVWDDEITKEKTAAFIFDNMISILKKEQGDFNFFIAVLKKIMKPA